MDGGGSSSSGTDLGRLEGWWNTSGIVLWSLVLFGSFLLNATLLLAFIKRPGLRTISNRFVMNLTVSNLLTCAVLNPLLMLDTPMENPIGGICAAAEGATALVTTTSILSVLLIAIDQYLAVVDPLRYRTRIDKFKCGLLMITVWLVSLLFSGIAALNPNPQSLWLVCQSQKTPSITTSNSSLELTINSSLVILDTRKNYTNNNISITEIKESIEILENSTEILKETVSITSTEINDKFFYLNYGFFYSIIYGIIIYLLPFIGVCWIYISIYSAAHKNSERTRRTGSRPILSSASFSEEYYPVRQDISSDDFRRIPKISSLSSIDESIEITTPSQYKRRLSDNHNQPSPIEEEESITTTTPTTVIFTVGSQQVDVTPQSVITKDKLNQNNNNNNKKLSISLLKAEFLEKKIDIKTSDDFIKSRFNDIYPEQKRKSSYDLMNEENLHKDLMRLRLNKNCDDNDCLSSDENDDDDDDDDNNNNNKTDDDDDDDVDGLTFGKNQSQDIEAGDAEVEKELITDEDLQFKINDDSVVFEEDETIQDFSKKCNKKICSNGAIRKSNLRLSSCHQDEPYRKYSAGNIDANGIFVTTNNTPIVTITPPNKPELHRVPSTRSTSSYINSLKYRISNGSLFKYREETRAARVSALVIVMVLICWTPYVVVLILKNLNGLLQINLSHETEVMAFSFLILSTYVSPLLFGYRSRRVKRELKKFFCFRNELQYKNNRSLMAKKVLKRRHSGNLFNADNNIEQQQQQRYNLFNCVYGKNKWPKDKVQFVQVPDTALVVETCRSSFSSGASTQISTTSTDES